MSRRYGGLTNQRSEPLEGIAPVIRLRSKAAGMQNENTSACGAPSRKFEQSLFHILRERIGLSNIEGELDGGLDFIDVLSAGPRRAYKPEFDLTVFNFNRGCDLHRGWPCPFGRVTDHGNIRGYDIWSSEKLSLSRAPVSDASKIYNARRRSDDVLNIQTRMDFRQRH